MKTAYRLACLLLLPVSLVAAEIKIGDSLEVVQKSLGQSRGQMQVGERLRLIYERGEVELRSGVVTRVAWRSEAAQAQYEARQAQAEQRATELNSARLAKWAAEGEALKARLLADETFQKSPATQQLATWRNLKLNYPMVNCSEQMSLLQGLAHEQLATLQYQQANERLARLEAEMRRNAVVADAYGSNTYQIGDAAWRNEYNARTYSENRHHYTHSYGRRDRWSDRDYGTSDRTDRRGRYVTTFFEPSVTGEWVGVPRFVPLNPQF